MTGKKDSFPHRSSMLQRKVLSGTCQNTSMMKKSSRISLVPTKCPEGLDCKRSGYRTVSCPSDRTNWVRYRTDWAEKVGITKEAPETYQGCIMICGTCSPMGIQMGRQEQYLRFERCANTQPLWMLSRRGLALVMNGWS
jgi:hypothetical protein